MEQPTKCKGIKTTFEHKKKSKIRDCDIKDNKS